MDSKGQQLQNTSEGKESIKSSESIKEGAVSLDDIGSSLGDLFADESSGKIPVILGFSAVEIDKTDRDVKEIVTGDVNLDIEGTKSPDDAPREQNASNETKPPNEIKAAAEIKVMDEAITSFDGKDAEDRNKQPGYADEVEGKKSEDETGIRNFEMGGQGIESELNLRDEFDENESSSSEEISPHLKYCLNIVENRKSRMQRPPSPSALRSAVSFSSSEDYNVRADLYDQGFIDFDIPRKTKLDRWEDVVSDLVKETEIEGRKDAGSGCSFDIDSDINAANKEQVEEWLVPVDPTYKKSPKQTVPRQIVTTAKLDDTSFRQSKGFGNKTAVRFDSSLPLRNPTEHIRNETPEKIALQNDYNTVTVKFLLRKGQIYSRAYQRSAKISELRRNVARVFKIPIEMIILQKDGIAFEDEVVLATLGIMPCGSVEIILESNDPMAYPVLYDNVLEEDPVADHAPGDINASGNKCTTCGSCNKLIPEAFQLLYDNILDELAIDVPDVINVTMNLSCGCYKELIVEIFNKAIKKPWLGGYHDTKTLVDYHHAFSQTPPISNKPKFTRDTQTLKPAVTQDQNTPYNKFTQISCDDYSISNINDRIVVAKPYIPFDDNISFLKKVITIQRFFRGWQVRKMLTKVSKTYKDQASKKASIKWNENVELENLLSGNPVCNMYPRSRQDFSILYNMVERWRQAEIKRVTSLKTEAPRKAELCYVLEKEIRLLNAIEKHRISVKKEKLEMKEIDFMEKSANPITWVGAKGKLISMATINTQRASELRDLYHQLTSTNAGKNRPRLEVLVSIKHAVRAFSSQNAKAFEIVALIERECRCLAGEIMTGSQLDFLRKRIAKSFRELMKEPEFNPEGSKYFTEETAYLQSQKNKYNCTRCDKYIPREKFVKTTRMKSIQHCISCAWLETVGGNRIDLSQFRTIMRSLRRDEKKRSCSASISFIMQEEDFYFLISKIWHGKSPISESDYLPDLRLCRWDMALDWTPWNCILLSNIEMLAHIHLPSPELAYSSSFIADVKSKHQTALLHFKTIMNIENL